ncbi:sugar ABC transporter substrate-binding protein [Marinomonas mediterranea]|uniref:sugar ABC transporter substrate-binding protein n=1 Tax=Marinomonas mediterranea TaxID=119864 RepID=UPI002349A15A|nr:sugar ABC transporter substrate-binding protein [Marinomonas mediterranea]WCN11348.1 substrate-binding domain-containing protein [Marinomonas mediterranea]WCN12236.1 substrate-binding domain-containing protein [Marinomonas mediterranea]
MASTLSPMSFAADLRISVSMATFDDNFITLLRNAIEKHGDELDNVELQVEDAKNEVGTQLNQIQNFIAADVDAIIVSPVDTDATVSMNDDAQYMNIPLVYVNRQPINVDLLPDNQAFIASNEVDSGTLQTKEVCRLMEGKGEIVVLMGALTDQTGIQRTQDIYDVLETDECSNIKIVEKQTGLWQRTMASDIMTNWLSAGVEFDGVIANNDEMAIGAIQALKAVSKDMDKIVVAGVDATQDALQAMREGDLDVTVFQDAAGQGAGSVDIAVKLANGEDVPQEVWVPFELVVPSNMEDYANRN